MERFFGDNIREAIKILKSSNRRVKRMIPKEGEKYEFIPSYREVSKEDCQSCRAKIEAETKRKCWEDLEKANIISNFHSELHYSFPQKKSICSCVVCRLEKLKQKWLGDK